MKHKFMLAALALCLASPALAHSEASAREHFDKIDANNDGMVSRAEVVAAAEAKFTRKDTNNDGMITFEEFEAALAEKKAEKKDRD